MVSVARPSLPRPRPELRACGALPQVLSCPVLPPDRRDPLPHGARVVVVVHALVAAHERGTGQGHRLGMPGGLFCHGDLLSRVANAATVSLLRARRKVDLRLWCSTTRHSDLGSVTLAVGRGRAHGRRGLSVANVGRNVLPGRASVSGRPGAPGWMVRCRARTLDRARACVAHRQSGLWLVLERARHCGWPPRTAQTQGRDGLSEPCREPLATGRLPSMTCHGVDCPTSIPSANYNY